MGSLGIPELLLIFAVALIVFGPRKLPEIGRTLGKALGEFKKATEDLKGSIEREVRADEIRQMTSTSLTVSRAEPVIREVEITTPAPVDVAESGSALPTPHEPPVEPVTTAAVESTPATPRVN
jgi:TatA/E family protein of Tat protein translocase